MSGAASGDDDPGPIAGGDVTGSARYRFRSPTIVSSEVRTGFATLSNYFATLTNEQLVERGIPPRLDASPSSKCDELWRSVFGRDLVVAPFVIDAATIQAAHEESSPGGSSFGGAAVTSGRNGVSRNWSGACVEPTHGRVFRQVWGRFTVPQAAPPPGAPLPASGKSAEYRCAAWVGLDGQRGYRNASLPQIGTEQIVTLASDGSQVHSASAWVQWWAEHDDGRVPPLRIPSSAFAVHAGDDIVCIVTVLDPVTALLNIVNLSRSPAIMVPVIANAPTSETGTLRYKISGSTAEWVLERPMIMRSKDLWPFPNFGAADFTDCLAVELAADGTVASKDLRSPRYINLYETNWDPPRVYWLSVIDRIDDNSFRAHYGNS